MSAKRTSSVLIGALFVGALSACEITRVDCDETPDASICQDDPFDSGIDWDADEPEGDAGTDGGSTDGGRDGGSTDGGSSDGGSSDGGSSDGGSGEPITIDEFCAEQVKIGAAWRDALQDLCRRQSGDGGVTFLAAAERDAFLLEVLAFPQETETENAEGKCIAARNAATATGNVKFNGDQAQACLDAFLAAFEPPPDPFPTDGIDLAMYEAKVAHGAPTLFQIPACRATFEGKLTRGMRCTDHFECIDGLRCLDEPSGLKGCEPALVGGTCTQSSQCADGYTCVGSSAGGGKTCVDSTMLPLNGGNCSFSLECSEGLVCDGSNKCANPTAQVICKP